MMAGTEKRSRPRALDFESWLSRLPLRTRLAAPMA
jgi:hypothetical protein